MCLEASEPSRKKADERNTKVMCAAADCDSWININYPTHGSIPRDTHKHLYCWFSGPVRPACCLLPPLGDSQKKLNSATKHYIPYPQGTLVALSASLRDVAKSMRKIKRRHKDKGIIVIKGKH